MQFRRLVVPAIVVIAACAPPQQTEDDTANIVDRVEADRYPSAGVLLYEDSIVCSGTLIHPRRVLTAAHCLDGRDPGKFTFGFGKSVDHLESVWVVRYAEQHPQWDGVNNDLAVLRIDDDVPVVPALLNPTMDASWIGRAVTVVGYGVRDPQTFTGAGTKHEFVLKIHQIDPTILRYTDLQGRAPCFGDSGGPALVIEGGKEHVVGISTEGDCRNYATSTRVDAYADFINSQIPLGTGPCEGETAEGRCDGTDLVYCDVDHVVRVDCSSHSVYNSCGFDPESQVFDCIAGGN
jgi:V8-like Glu-specific endopeptidase